MESQAHNGGDTRNTIALGFLFRISDSNSPFYRMVDSSQHNQIMPINAYNGLYGMVFEKE